MLYSWWPCFCRYQYIISYTNMPFPFWGTLNNDATQRRPTDASVPHFPAVLTPPLPVHFYLNFSPVLYLFTWVLLVITTWHTVRFGLVATFRVPPVGNHRLHPPQKRSLTTKTFPFIRVTWTLNNIPTFTNNTDRQYIKLYFIYSNILH